jgi:hypothetical protein
VRDLKSLLPTYQTLEKNTMEWLTFPFYITRSISLNCPISLMLKYLQDYTILGFCIEDVNLCAWTSVCVSKLHFYTKF